jgi:hypothetical protein
MRTQDGEERGGPHRSEVTRGTPDMGCSLCNESGGTLAGAGVDGPVLCRSGRSDGRSINESLEGPAEKGRVSLLTFVPADEDVDGQPDVFEKSFRAHDFMPLRREVCAAFDDLRDQVRFQAVINNVR